MVKRFLRRIFKRKIRKPLRVAETRESTIDVKQSRELRAEMEPYRQWPRPPGLEGL